MIFIEILMPNFFSNRFLRPNTDIVCFSLKEKIVSQNLNSKASISTGLALVGPAIAEFESCPGQNFLLKIKVAISNVNNNFLLWAKKF